MTKPAKAIYRCLSLVVLTAALAGLFLLPSCLPEHKIANTFRESAGGINLLVIPPDYLFKFNHKGEEIDDFKALTMDQQDSALWVHSHFLQYLSDSIILENYMNKFIADLRKSGFNVYLDTSVDSFMTAKPQSYVVDISQVQLDEYYYPLEDEGEFDDTVYKKKVNLNAVDFSCWIDLSKANTENARKTVLYHTASSYDSFDGRFFNDPFTGKVQYRYKIDSLRINDIYAMATYMGRTHAAYLYDFFMNQYIAKHLPEGIEMEDYFHYDVGSRTFGPAYDERFRILPSK